jgi:hypothetical protein
MKKLFLMAFLAIGMTAHAEPIVNIDDDENENKGGINLGQGQDDNDRWSMHLSLGVDVPTGAPDGIKFAPFRSWEFNWTILQYDYTPKKWKTTFSAGLGFNWRAYTLRGHDKMFDKAGNHIIVEDNIFFYDNLSSNVHTTSLSMPLLVKQRFSRNFAISVGAQLNWNFYGRIHNYYETGDDEIDVYTKDMGQRPFSVDILGIIHVWELGVYCKYSPMSILKTDRGPEFQSLAFGIYF